MGEKVDVQVLNDLLRAARFYCDREGAENCSNYANDMLERGEKCIAAVAELIEAVAEKFASDDDKHEKGYRTVGMDLRSMSANDRLRAALARIGAA